VAARLRFVRFFFSSRRRHTRFSRDWSSDVCSSDLIHFLETLFVAIIDAALAAQNAVVVLEALGLGSVYIGAIRNRPQAVAEELRSEERRVGKGGRGPMQAARRPIT